MRLPLLNLQLSPKDAISEGSGILLISLLSPIHLLWLRQFFFHVSSYNRTNMSHTRTHKIIININICACDTYFAICLTPTNFILLLSLWERMRQLIKLFRIAAMI